ncbi:MAG: FliI/YscN family ATPase [Polyangiaceae bacterium]|nr:FliI/YscN family ATPase [Polyangiaceae bacterium]
MTPPGDLARARPVAVSGRVVGVTGGIVRAALPLARVGERARVLREGAPLDVEIIGFDERAASLAPLGETAGVRLGDVVEPVEAPLTVRVGEGCLGRVLGPLGAPVDGRGPLEGGREAPLRRAPPALTERRPVTRQLVTGLRVIDALAPLGEGQRVGLFAPSGAGKSTLLARLAAASGADVVVLGLVGERGREAAELAARVTSSAGARAVVIVATSDAPPLARVCAAECATAIAEGFRDTGRRVLLAVDSITRVARALRELGLAAGEPPARRGFPPSTFSYLPRLFERAGATATGTITAIYSVLVEGDDPDEPVADEVRGLLDGHLVLSRGLLARGVVPPVDPVASLSRVSVTPEDVTAQRRRCVAWLATLEQKRELVALGGHAPGRDPLLDEALSMERGLDALVRQPDASPAPLAETRRMLEQLTR